MTKKLLSLLLALIMLCSVMGGMAYADDDTDEAERSADIVILFTSDVHCGIDQGFGYAGVTAVYDYLAAQGNQVILVDDGDSIQGEPIGTMTKGEALLDLMNKVGYSVAIPGNHEFDYGMDRFLDLAKQAKFSYVSCNFNHKGELIFDPYVIRELDGMKVAFVGVTTPKTLTSSTPRYFQDENGEFVYGFFQDDTGEGVYKAVQSAVDDARAEGADYVVVLGHMGNEEECHPWTYADVISHVSGIDVFLDGHSHDTDQVVMKDKDGREVLRAACGTKLACIGWCRIDTEGKISTGLYTWNNKESAPALLGITNKGATYVESATGTLEKKLEEVVANSQVLLTINDPEAVDNNGAPIRMVRRAETNLGDLCADAYRSQSGADIAFVNGGGVRVNINAGKITLNDILRVHPFGNAMCVIEVSGQQILDALEWGARAIPGETGGFLQVSGLSYEIHSYIDSPCKTDENSMFAGIEGERRVKNVLVDGKPIDPEATYTLASHDYMLLNNGDGYTMFDGAPLLQDRVKLDNQVLIDYITETLGGVIGEEYEDLTGDGRIVIVEEKP
ncbi:MAG: bifunctional metallophosphatase/5'-nucleotidase [Oscillospiraceae bacterium]|nr:bifunctional metallophosphatase/5'-nucleotidase [Oscillospiraceae bacterium]